MRLFAVNSSKHPVLYWAAYMTMMAVTHSFMNSQVRHQSLLQNIWRADTLIVLLSRYMGRTVREPCAFRSVCGIVSHPVMRRGVKTYVDPSYLSIYGILVFATIASYAVAWLFYISGSMHASRIIHSKLVTSILGTTLR